MEADLEPAQARISRRQAKYDLRVPNLLKSVDLFGRALPSFSLQGQTQVHTYSGGLITLLIVYITFLFGTLKF